MSTFVISDGDLYACGNNKFGQLGLNNILDISVFVHNIILSQQEISFVAVSSEDDHSLALDSDGNLWSCGNNTFSQLGLGSDMRIVKTFTKVPIINCRKPQDHPGTIFCDVHFTNIACCDLYSLAIDTDGNLWDSGRGSDMKDNIFLEIQHDSPEDGAVFSSICCGYIKAFALDIEGNLWCCNHRNNPSVFIKIFTTTKFKAVACGVYHCVPLDINGNLWAIGSNEDGQIGLNDCKSAKNLSQITCSPGFAAISCGNYHTTALDNEGNLWACGSNSNGQLGLNDQINRKMLTKVVCDGVTSFMAVSCGTCHTVALDIDRNLWSTCYNYLGQLGLHDNTDKNRLTRVPNLKADILWNQQIIPKRKIKSAASTVIN